MQFAILLLTLWVALACGNSDIDALLEFRKGIKKDPSGKILNSWTQGTSAKSNGCLLNWYGVQCDGDHISAVTLNDMGLVGTITFSALSKMEMLCNLSVSNNNFEGILSPDLGLVSSLEVLDLSGNSFEGSIPNELMKLGNLVYLILSLNHFGSLLSSGFGSLKKLKYLDLRDNSFSGNLSGILAQLQSLVFADLSRNQLSGSMEPLSEDSTNSSALQYLNVSYNRLSGELFSKEPVPFLDYLEVFDARFNRLSGNVPSFNFMISLQTLHLGNNEFSGSLPEALIKESSMVLTELDLSCNQITEFESRKLQPLSLSQRLSIAIDVARCLHYLHNERAIPHGNLKSTNILIQAPDMNALLTDYSLHRIMTPAGMADQVLNAGALGYRPPEFASMSKHCPSLKSDVYAFGVVLLEILTGKSAGEIVSGNPGVVDLTDWVRLLASENRAHECFDRLMLDAGSADGLPKVLEDILRVALRCIRSASERPEIRTVFEDLSSISL